MTAGWGDSCYCVQVGLPPPGLQVCAMCLRFVLEQHLSRLQVMCDMQWENDHLLLRAP